ncbi:unnamed protein product [Darwinula stevensoni]|uniref:MICOS complex subunit MIC13 n=1 Tax=Darwinula stevensoni TaxID=69355 RepID=A0A7R9A9H0_9CRUS|nr:unnamed protein product [Darwinula stevensoni]CAG0897295.1 unnamed protein product [Darwinula stevensoni]
MGRLFRSVMKLGLTGGAVYGSCKVGVWGDGSNTTNVLKNIDESLNRVPGLPMLKQELSKIEVIPEDLKDKKKARDYWNTGVIAIFAFIMELPELSQKWACVSYRTISAYMQDITKVREPQNKT